MTSGKRSGRTSDQQTRIDNSDLHQRAMKFSKSAGTYTNDIDDLNMGRECVATNAPGTATRVRATSDPGM